MSSNINEFISNLHKIMDDVGLDRPEVLDRLENTYTDVLTDRAANQVGPGGARWDDNQPAYAARKGNLPVGVLTGEMLAPANLKVAATYISNRLYLHHDGSPESLRHLSWFEQGGRILWGLDEDARQRFRAVIADHIHDNLRNKK